MGPSRLKKFVTSRRIFCLASRDDLIKFAEGEQASSDSLDLLKGYNIVYNILMAFPEKSNVWKENASIAKNIRVLIYLAGVFRTDSI